MAALFRLLVLECADPQFLRSVSQLSTVTHFIFLGLVVLNLVAGFQALGTLMSVGLMILPAAAARFWAQGIGAMIGVAVLVAITASITGLILSYYYSLPSGPAIILVAGALYLSSVMFGNKDSLITRYLPRQHLKS
jgi:zinc/manganese transport system permease protein